MKAKRIVCGLLMFALAVGCVGCLSGGTKGKTDGKSLTIWAESSTTKIKRDDGGEAVKNADKKDVLTINMAKNESEGVQLMMYAKKDVPFFDIELSDLKNEDATIAADTVDIYMMKYMVSKGGSNTKNPAFQEGEIPDPMLSFDTAVEYEENTIDAKNNQAIFFDVQTTEDTTPGLYSGMVTVKLQKETYKIPMEVMVYDVTIDTSQELKSAFSILERDTFATAELDASDEMGITYFETLLDYNMSCALPFDGEGGIERYLELLKKYYDAPGFTSYRLYYEQVGSIYKGQTCGYNVPLFKEYVKAIAEMAVVDKVNYLDKAYSYFLSFVDEPQNETMWQTAKQYIDIYELLLKDCDAELREKYAGTENYQYYVDTVSETLLTIPNALPITGDKLADFRKYEADGYTGVVTLTNVDTEIKRNDWRVGREDRELWIYSAQGPAYPYPTNHIDTYCLGWRIEGWMCFDYQWDAFLYWCATDYLYTEMGDPIADPWLEMDAGFGSAGEGRFLYPGKKYGLDAPCPSIRAIAFRDGTEDYALLAKMQDLYQEQGLDASAALEELYNQLYTEVFPITDSDKFEQVRKTLFEMITNFDSDTTILYKEVTVDFDKAEVIFKCLNDKAMATVDGKKVELEKDGFYHSVIDLTKQSSCTIEISCGDAKTTYTREIMENKLKSVQRFEEKIDPADYIFSTSKGYEASFNQDKKYAQEGAGSIHLILNKNEEETLPYFGISKDSELIGGSCKELAGMKFYVYNPSEKDIEMDITYYTTDERTLQTCTLSAGRWTLVEFTLPQTIENPADILEFDFNFEENSKVELYIDSFASMLKGE